MSVINIRVWRPFRKVVAISATIQGLAWLLMAAICIGMYYGKDPQWFKTLSEYMITNQTNYIDLISFSFYDTFLYSDNNYEDRLLKPQNFQIFAWLYAGLSMCWFGIALSECLALFKKKKSNHNMHVTMFLGIITVVTCILDLILLGLIVTDYSKINVFEYGDVLSWYDIDPTTTVSPTNAEVLTVSDTASQLDFIDDIGVIFKYKIGRKLCYGILLTICARGFVLWIFNFVSGIILLRISTQMFRAPPILKYDNRSIPRAKIDQESKDDNSFFGQEFGEDYSRMSTPPLEKKNYYEPSRPSDRYGFESRNNPLALSGNNRRNDNIFS